MKDSITFPQPTFDLAEHAELSRGC